MLLHVVMFVFSVIVFTGALAVMMIATKSDLESTHEDVVLGLAQSLAMLFSVFCAAIILDRRRWRELGVGSHWWFELTMGLLFGFVAMLGIFGVEYALGWVEVGRVGPDASISVSEMLIAQVGWLSLMVSVGYAEEYMSRGYHLKNIAEGMRWLGRTGAVSVAVLLSSLVFGLLHAGNDNASLVSTAGIVLAGIMLAVGRLVTGSLAAPIGLHISWNYCQGPLLGFPVSGNLTEGSFMVLEQGGNVVWSGGEFGPEAGLIGVIAEVLLIAAFVVWGLIKGNTKRYATELVRYRRRASRKYSIADGVLPPVDYLGVGHNPGEQSKKEQNGEV